MIDCSIGGIFPKRFPEAAAQVQKALQEANDKLVSEGDMTAFVVPEGGRAPDDSVDFVQPITITHKEYLLQSQPEVAESIANRITDAVKEMAKSFQDSPRAQYIGDCPIGIDSCIDSSDIKVFVYSYSL